MKDQEYDYFYEDEQDAKYCYPGTNVLKNKLDIRGIIELVYIVLQSVVKPGITGFFKIDLHIKCYIYLS